MSDFAQFEQDATASKTLVDENNYDWVAMTHKPSEPEPVAPSPDPDPSELAAAQHAEAAAEIRAYEQQQAIQDALERVEEDFADPVLAAAGLAATYGLPAAAEFAQQVDAEDDWDEEPETASEWIEQQNDALAQYVAQAQYEAQLAAYQEQERQRAAVAEATQAEFCTAQGHDPRLRQAR
jgi:hypothetical protein